MSGAARAWPRHRRQWTASLLMAVLTTACSDPDNKPQVGSNSNWLRICSSDTECFEGGVCLCGACSRSCSADVDCADLEEGACVQAATPAAESQCLGQPSAVPTGMCLPRCTPGSCLQGQACIAGSCVLYELPAVDLCTSVANRSQEDRAAEESLLELVQVSREQGGLDCQSGQLTAPATPFAIDPRATCAARALAMDLDTGSGSGVTDAQGRDGGERLALAGYSGGTWAEMVAVGVTSAEQALSLLTADSRYCSVLTSPAYTTVGVGHVGRIYVVTLTEP